MKKIVVLVSSDFSFRCVGFLRREVHTTAVKFDAEIAFINLRIPCKKNFSAVKNKNYNNRSRFSFNSMSIFLLTHSSERNVFK